MFYVVENWVHTWKFLCLSLWLLKTPAGHFWVKVDQKEGRCFLPSLEEDLWRHMVGPPLAPMTAVSHPRIIPPLCVVPRVIIGRTDRKRNRTTQYRDRIKYVHQVA